MPLFEFRCPACDNQFEYLVRGQESVQCPKCQNAKPEKLMSAAAAHGFKSASLPVSSACPPSDAPPCRPNCCRIPQ
ncbi:FmdB family zinc ribbon protein [Thalassoroseus pseudoceratinae]|uniref:FmdB family zinc ribbon protein n=1 Tax=Thalassoroseus pseudoceratinae TaxID=2713176 RepID=UPI00141DAA79|nr:zinc ribbon domain-containing protein [Thalassoroseus pseudoceratinae]